MPKKSHLYYARQIIERKVDLIIEVSLRENTIRVNQFNEKGEMVFGRIATDFQSPAKLLAQFGKPK